MPDGTPLTTPDVALPVSAELTCAAVAVGFASRYKAAAPTTCGVAMDVPLMVLVAVLLPIHAEVMFTPGARILTHDPKFEKEAQPSLMVVAPVVIAVGVLDGDELHALAALLPAATAKTTPAAMEFVTAAFSADENDPPRLMLATAGLCAFAVTQSTPAITCE